MTIAFYGLGVFPLRSVLPCWLAQFAGAIAVGSMNPARTLGPDLAGVSFTGWWAYVLGDLIGVVIAVSLIALVRGMPGKAERAAAQGGGLPQ